MGCGKSKHDVVAGNTTSVTKTTNPESNKGKGIENGGNPSVRTKKEPLRDETSKEETQGSGEDKSAASNDVRFALDQKAEPAGEVNDEGKGGQVSKEAVAKEENIVVEKVNGNNDVAKGRQISTTEATEGNPAKNGKDEGRGDQVWNEAVPKEENVTMENVKGDDEVAKEGQTLTTEAKEGNLVKNEPLKQDVKTTATGTTTTSEAAAAETEVVPPTTEAKNEADAQTAVASEKEKAPEETKAEQKQPSVPSTGETNPELAEEETAAEEPKTV